MAGSQRTQLVDRGVTLDSFSDKHQTSLRNRTRSRSRDRSRGRRQITARSRSRSRSLLRDDDRYRPTRTRETIRRRSPSDIRRQHYSPVSRISRKESRSPRRVRLQSRKSDRGYSRDRSPPRARIADSSRRDYARAYSPKPTRESHRSSRQSPRRRSPDSYIPPSRRRSRSPLASTYRPADLRPHERSPAPARRLERRNNSPRAPEPRRRLTTRGSRSPRREIRSKLDTFKPSDRHAGDTYRRPIHRSPSPIRRKNPPSASQDRPSRQDKRRRELLSTSRSPPRRKQRIARSTEGSANGDSKMGDRYFHGTGRGGHRTGRPPVEIPGYGASPPFYPPDQMSPHAQSPYGGGRGGWGPQPPYGSHQG